MIKVFSYEDVFAASEHQKTFENVHRLEAYEDGICISVMKTTKEKAGEAFILADPTARNALPYHKEKYRLGMLLSPKSCIVIYFA